MKRAPVAATLAVCLGSFVFAPSAGAFNVPVDGGVLYLGPANAPRGEALALDVAANFAADPPSKLAIDVAHQLGYSPPAEVTIELADAGLEDGGLGVSLTATPAQINGGYVQTIPFPLPWAPTLPATGWAFMQLTPEMFYPPTSGDSYFAYNFSWWLAGNPTVTADTLANDLLISFEGTDYGCVGVFGPCNLGNFNAHLTELPEISIERDVRTFIGDVTLYDYLVGTGDLITLHVIVHTFDCAADGHRLVNFAVSPEPYGDPIWSSLMYQQAAFASCN